MSDADREEMARRLLEDMFRRWEGVDIGPPVDKRILDEWEPADRALRSRLQGGDCLEGLEPLAQAWAEAIDAREALILAEKSAGVSDMSWVARLSQFAQTAITLAKERDTVGSIGIVGSIFDVGSQKVYDEVVRANLAGAERQWRAAAKTLAQVRNDVRACLATGWKGSISISEKGSKVFPPSDDENSPLVEQAKVSWYLNGTGTAQPSGGRGQGGNQSATIRFAVTGLARHELQYDRTVRTPNCILDNTSVTVTAKTSGFSISVALECTDTGVCQVILPRQFLYPIGLEKGVVKLRSSCDVDLTERPIDAFYTHEWEMPRTVLGQVVITNKTLSVTLPVGNFEIKRRTDSDEVPVHEVTTQLHVAGILRRGPD